jgi:hypothetical protein
MKQAVYLILMHAYDIELVGFSYLANSFVASCCSEVFHDLTSTV